MITLLLSDNFQHRHFLFLLFALFLLVNLRDLFSYNYFSIYYGSILVGESHFFNSSSLEINFLNND